MCTSVKLNFLLSPLKRLHNKRIKVVGTRCKIIAGLQCHTVEYNYNGKYSVLAYSKVGQLFQKGFWLLAFLLYELWNLE
jgi:hypothetical protein